MVGVPGRSKACNTCKKRRIACSLDTPQCKQCLKSNRVCGGYQRERVWVPNNQVKLGVYPHKSISEPGPVRPKHRNKETPNQGEAAVTLPNDSSAKSQYGGEVALPKLWKVVHSFYPMRQLLLSEFLYNWVPEMDRVTQPMAALAEVSWLQIISDLPEITIALEMSLLAFSSAKLGRADNNTPLIMESRKLYCKSLRELQVALWDPALMFRDETLAACLTLFLYEVVECPTETMTGLVSHSDGCTRLVKLRGPQAHQSPLGHQLFLSCRFNAAWQALSTNRKIFLGDPEWMTLPWHSTPKTLTDKLVDLFVSGLAVLEAAAELEALKQTKWLIAALRVIDSCWKLDAELHELYKELEESILGPLFWPELSKDDNPADDVELGRVFPVSYHFLNLRVSYMCNLYWTIGVILWGGLFHLYQAIIMMQPATAVDLASPEECQCTTPVHVCGQHAANFDISTLPSLKDRNPITAAQNICQSFEYCALPKHKDFGVRILTFPLQVAVSVLKEHPGCERELHWARASIDKIEQMGLRILKFTERT